MNKAEFDLKWAGVPLIDDEYKKEYRQDLLSIVSQYPQFDFESMERELKEALDNETEESWNEFLKENGDENDDYIVEASDVPIVNDDGVSCIWENNEMEEAFFTNCGHELAFECLMGVGEDFKYCPFCSKLIEIEEY